MKNSLSLVVCTYRGRREKAEKCLSSIYSQSVKPFEVIVISDRKEVWIDNYPFKLFVIPEMNLCYRKNFAVSKAKGRAILFIDDDMILNKDFVKFISVFDSIEYLDAITCNIGNLGEYRKKVNLWIAFCRLFFFSTFGDGSIGLIPIGLYLHGFNNFSVTNFFSGGLSAYKKEIFDNCKFDEKLGELSPYCSGEDVEFSLQLKNRFGYYVPMAKANHYSVGSNPGKNDVAFSQSYIVNRFYIMKKHDFIHFRNLVALMWHSLGRFISYIFFERNPLKILGLIKGLRFIFFG